MLGMSFFATCRSNVTTPRVFIFLIIVVSYLKFERLYLLGVAIPDMGISRFSYNHKE